MSRFTYCTVHEMIWDRTTPCPCRAFPLSECNMVDIVSDAPSVGKLLEAAADVAL